MKSGVQWLKNAWRSWHRAEAVALAYRQQIDPQGANGRLILADLAAYCRVGQTSFVAGDPHQTAFNEGARDVFLHVAEMTGLSPADFPQLIEDLQHDD